MYKARGFDNIEDMNNAILKNWNAAVGEEDDVYVLGDLMLNDNRRGLDLLKQLNGYLHIILGNHDSDARVELYQSYLPKVVEIVYSTIIKVEKQHYYLSHYPSFTANYDDKPYHSHLINLYGHTHQQTNFFTIDGKNNPFMYHVGVDSHGCTPVSIEQISEDIHNEVNYLYHLKA